MENSNGGEPGSTRATWLLAILFLFFIQHTGTWIESIYRLALIKLEMGAEMAGILLVLLPLGIVAVPKKAAGIVFSGALLVVLATRALSPHLGASAQIFNSGIGASAFVVVLCYVLSREAPLAPGDMGRATGLAVLLSVVFRAWGSSIDISMEAPTAILGWALIVAAMVLFAIKRPVVAATFEDQTIPLRASFAPVFSIFSSLTFIYLVVSSPAVVSAWAETNYFVGTALLTICCASMLFASRVFNVEGATLVVWNAVFVAALLLGILLNTPSFPATPESPVTIVDTVSWLKAAPLYLMFALSPVLLVNIRAATRRAFPASARAMAIPLFLGMVFMVAITLMLIFTNVWGYVGAVSHALRNKFYLPFLIAGVVMVVSSFWSGRRSATRKDNEATGALSFKAAALLVTLAAIVGVYVRSAKIDAPSPDKKKLTILTYNIQQGSALEGDRNYRNQLEFIRTINPDLVGLQESDVARPSGGNVDVARYFAVHLGYYVYYGPSTIAGTFGTAILSRYPIENPHSIYSYSTVDEVGTACVEIEVGGRRIAFFNNHPAGPDPVMHAHVDALIAEVRKYEHVISVGDYNFRQDEPFYAKLAGVLTNSWMAIYPDAIGKYHPSLGSRPSPDAPLDMTKRIDHVFVSSGFHVAETYYVPTPDSQTDHPAHWSVVRWE